MPPPEPTSERVVVTEDAIVINDKIHFDLDKATIRPESYDLLNEIVDVINKNGQIEKISIEGHTCSLGSEQHNAKLSSDRAASVMAYLTEHGVAADRLSSLGHGESRPIASNEDEASREKNRRVEFLITAQKQLETVYDVNKQTGERTMVSQSAGGVASTPAAPADKPAKSDAVAKVPATAPVAPSDVKAAEVPAPPAAPRTPATPSTTEAKP